MKKNQISQAKLEKRERVLKIAQLQLIIDEKAIRLVIKNHRLKVGKRELLVFVVTVIILLLIIFAFSFLKTN